MKKFLLVLLLLSLVGCKAKKEDYYNLSFDDKTIVVGYDNVDVINGIIINSYTSHINKKEEEILDYVEIYLKDINTPLIYIDGYEAKSITNTCNDLNGDVVTNNGNTCVLHKTIKDVDNIIILHGDILDDDIDKVDRVEVIYK